MDAIATGTHYVLEGAKYLTGIQPLPSRFNTLFYLGWLAWLAANLVLIVFWRIEGSDTSISGLVGVALFAFVIFAYMLVIVEVNLTWRNCRRFRQLEKEVDQHFEHHLHLDVAAHRRDSRTFLKVLIVILVVIATDGIRVWMHCQRQISPVFWNYLSCMHGLRIRFLQLIVLVMETNERVEWLKEALVSLAAYNEPKSIYKSDIWMPYTAWEYDQLNVIRIIYGRLYEMYETINECFGWSILGIFVVTFFVSLSNAFWCISIVVRHKPMERFLFNSAEMLAIVCLTCMLVWYVELSCNNSREIGGLIFKLVKPMGNKRYSDLVNEFSVQALHQRFMVKAKDFFDIDFPLLGSLIAVTVTHLVILVQFMFPEGRYTKTGLKSPLELALNSTVASVSS